MTPKVDAETLQASKLLSKIFDDHLNSLNKLLLAEEDRDKRDDLWQQHFAVNRFRKDLYGKLHSYRKRSNGN